MGKLIFVLCVAGSFCVLSSYCWARTHAPERHVMEDRAKPVAIWRTHRAEVIAEVYGVSPDELDEPLNIWGKK